MKKLITIAAALVALVVVTVTAIAFATRRRPTTPDGAGAATT